MFIRPEGEPTIWAKLKRRNDMADRKLLPGKFVWFEHVSTDPKKAQKFYAEVLGWKVKPFPLR